MKNLLLYFLIISGLFSAITAQPSQQKSAGQIFNEIKRFNTLGRALYVAAHPDDENTRLIAYLSKAMGIQVGYLSLTRGDGGQNLIGPELREELGLIRTEELLAARSIDGGYQFFSRANDFGYSKSPDEAFATWNKKEVLSDAVWVFRNFRPDVIITRFSKTPGITHGHHTGSAIIAHEAFEFAADPNAFSDQLEYTTTWQPHQIFWNTSSWFFRNNEFDPERFLEIDISDYLPELGRSVTEIASVSRSQHKSQGFGATTYRNPTQEYLEFWDGQPGNLFEGLDITWRRIEGESGEILFEMGQELISTFDLSSPSSSVPLLIRMRQEILRIEDEHWKQEKLKEVDKLIKQCLGLFIDATTSQHSVYPGEDIPVNFEITNRYNRGISIQQIRFQGETYEEMNGVAAGDTYSKELNISIPRTISYSTPYWLKEEGTVGLYRVENQQDIGKARLEPGLTFQVEVQVNGSSLYYDVPLQWKERDPVQGELYGQVAILPRVNIALEEELLIFNGSESKTIAVTLDAKTAINGQLSVKLPTGWEASVPDQKLSLVLDRPVTVEVNITSGAKSAAGNCIISFTSDDEIFNYKVTTIGYSHIPTNSIVRESSVKLIPLDIRRNKTRIGYVMGAGDVIPENLEILGYEVTLIDPSFTADQLDDFETIIIGIRAYNTREDLAGFQDELFDYVSRGGTLITQYNNSYNLVTEGVSPIPLTLSRLRVTDEESPVKILRDDHPVFAKPNKISMDDFDGWVQERGLYFASSWGDAFVPLLAFQDPGEDFLEGSLLVADYGKGHFIYTSLSFFRELPAGVQGAYRLFVNLIEY